MSKKRLNLESLVFSGACNQPRAILNVLSQARIGQYEEHVARRCKQMNYFVAEFCNKSESD